MSMNVNVRWMKFSLFAAIALFSPAPCHAKPDELASVASRPALRKHTLQDLMGQSQVVVLAEVIKVERTPKIVKSTSGPVAVKDTFVTIRVDSLWRGQLDQMVGKPVDLVFRLGGYADKNANPEPKIGSTGVFFLTGFNGSFYSTTFPGSVAVFENSDFALTAATELARVRITNKSNIDYDQVIAQIGSWRVNYGRLQAGQTSAYATVDMAYRYAYIEIHIGKQELFLRPIDYVGEEAYRTGSFTYALTAHSGAEEGRQIDLEWLKDQQVEKK